MSSLGRSAEKLARLHYLQLQPRQGLQLLQLEGEVLGIFSTFLSVSVRTLLLQLAMDPVTVLVLPARSQTPFRSLASSVPELIYPKREEGDTPAGYSGEARRSGSSKFNGHHTCARVEMSSQRHALRKYMRGFSYFGESIDMAIRKMLMEVELPKETQQIDRLLGGFADRYYECNPGIFASTRRNHVCRLLDPTPPFGHPQQEQQEKDDQARLFQEYSARLRAGVVRHFGLFLRQYLLHAFHPF